MKAYCMKMPCYQEIRLKIVVAVQLHWYCSNFLMVLNSWWLLLFFQEAPN